MAVAAKKSPFLFDSSDALEKGLKFFRKLGKSKYITCRYGYIDNKGQGHPPNNTACHAGLSYPTSGDNTEYVVEYLDSHPDITKEMKRAFAEWLVNFSPFRSIFVERDIEKIMDDEFVVASVDHPYTLLAAGLMACRALSEHPSTGKIWYELVSNGCHPSLAFYIAYAYKTDGKQLWPGHSQHTGCYDPICVQRGTLVNFLNDNITKKSDSYRKKKYYSGSHALFSGGGEDVTTNLTKAINKAVNKQKGTANPFAKPAAGDRWEFKEGCKALAAAIKEEFKTELEKLNGKA